MYENCNADMYVMMGDLNSRVGNMKDFIPEIDDIPDRQVVDETDNGHGSALIDFLLESKLAIVNSRICPLQNNYTCILQRAKAPKITSWYHMRTCLTLKILITLKIFRY